jgi:hypothetical protein
VHSLIMLDPNWIWLYAPGVHRMRQGATKSTKASKAWTQI